MRLSSYISFFFLFGTLVLALPADPSTNNLNLREDSEDSSGGANFQNPGYKRASGDEAIPLF